MELVKQNLERCYHEYILEYGFETHNDNTGITITAVMQAKFDRKKQSQK